MTLTTRKRCLLSTLALLTFFSIVSAHEQSSDHYTMPKDVLSNGGDKSHSSNYQMVATVGQYATRKGTANGNVLYSGFYAPRSTRSPKPNSACGGVTEGLVACYPFDGDAKDGSGNGNHGTVHGVTLTADRFGNADSAYNFDGNDQIIVDSFRNFHWGKHLSISVWFKRTGQWGNYQGIVNNGYGRNGSWEIRMGRENNGTMLGGGILTSSNSEVWDFQLYASQNEWHHVVMTYDGSNFSFYLDAMAQSGGGNDSGEIIAKDTPLTIGQAGHGTNNEYFFGSIDDILVYNRALSESEIKTLYTLEPCNNDSCTKEETYRASGTIRDKAGNPLPGITIKIGDKTTVTDATGYWEINSLQEGNYEVIATKDGYTFPSQTCALGNNENCTPKIKPGSVLDIKVVPNNWKPAKQGENVTYTITVTNQGEETATAVVLTDTLPESTTLVSIEAMEGGECDADTVTCTLPDLTPGATATVKLVISNAQAKSLVNKATVTANEYPDDVQITWTAVKPYLSVTLSDTPDPVSTGATLHYTADVDLNHNAPTTTATGVQLVMHLPKGVELKSLNTDYGICDSSKLPTVICELTDLSIDSPEAISHITVHTEVQLNDPGLLLLTHEATVKANEYPTHTDRERTKIAIPEGIKVDIAFVIDVTGSMQQEINGVIRALKGFIAEIEPSKAPLIALIVFTDDVKIQAFTRDLDVLLGAVEKLKATGGGTCPEASIEALLIAVPHTKEGGEILFATDASPYADAEIEKVMALLRGKGIRFNAMITGDCSNESDWNQLPE